MGNRKGVKSKRNYLTWMELGYSESDARFEARKRMPGTYEYFHFFKEYPEEESKKLVKEWKEKNLKRSKKNYIEKFGKTEGMKKWNNYKNKQAYSNTYEYKKQKYGWTKKDFEKYNKSRATTEKNMIKKYGEFEGRKKWVEYVEKQRYSCSEEYFIEKYGKIKGIKKYRNFCYIRDNVIKQKRIGLRSKISEELFSILDKLFQDRIFLWGENEFKVEKISGGCFHVDFYCLKTLKVIEFYGDVFHANPLIYQDDEMLFIGKTAKELRDKNIKRENEILKNPNINDLLVIWEKDYRQNKSEIIKTCVDFLEE